MRGEWRRGSINEWVPKFPRASILVGCTGAGEGSLGKILKTKNAEAISGHSALRLKSQIYLHYAYLQMFQRRKTPFIPCFIRIALCIVFCFVQVSTVTTSLQQLLTLLSVWLNVLFCVLHFCSYYSLFLSYNGSWGRGWVPVKPV